MVNHEGVNCLGKLEKIKQFDDIVDWLVSNSYVNDHEPPLFCNILFVAVFIKYGPPFILLHGQNL